MIRLLWWAAIFVAAWVALCTYMANAQNVEGQIIASEFGQYLVPAQTTGSFSFPPAACQVSGGNKNFAAFTRGVPVKIIDSNPALDEIATPSSVYINTCVINMATQYTHVPPFYLTSGTGGLQEAIINGPSKQGAANTIILNADWYTQVQPGNAANVIATVQGNATIGLVDVTTVPYTFYQWNGSQYVAVTIGGGVTSINSNAGAFTFNGSGVNCVTQTCTFSSGGATYGWVNNLASAQGLTDNTITLNTSVASYPASGTFYVDGEYEKYTGKNTGSNQLTGVSRGACSTTATTHNNTVFAVSVDLPFGDCTQVPSGGVFGVANIGAGVAQILSANCATPSIVNDAGAITVFNANCTNPTQIDSAGRIHQFALSSIYNYLSPVCIGNNAVDIPFNIGQPICITNTTNVAQTNGAAQFGQPVGFTAGIAGPVQSKSVANIPAPTLNGQTGGSCSITYEVAGVDADGFAVPGATATVSSLSFPSAGIVYIQTPQVAGVVTYTPYRTAVSGCGSIGTGRFVAGSTAQYPQFIDTGGTGDGVLPPATNTTFAKTCTNGETYCTLAGTGAVPPVACGSATYGWEYHNVAATTSPYVYHCVSGASSWSTAY